VEGPTGPAEPTSSHYIINWGGGIHACPGKNFALYAIKICVAHFILNFDFEIKGGVPEFNYHGALALCQRDVKFRVKRND
jgi:cytochrome P450